MALKLEELLAPLSADAQVEALLTALRARGWQVTAWGTFDGGRALVESEGVALGLFGGQQLAIVKGAYLDTSEDDWLTLKAASDFSLERGPTAYASGMVRLTAQPGAGPYAIGAGGVWVTTGGGLKYNSTNAAGVVLPAGGTLDVPVRAESPGSRYNVPLGTSLALVTALPGVTVATHDLGAGDWLSAAGADVESDANLRARCRSRWAALAGYAGVGGATALAYEHWARTANGVGGNITKVAIDSSNPFGPGSVRVYVAGPAGGLGGGDPALFAAQTQLDAIAPIGADVQVVGATNHAITVTAEVFVYSAYLAAVTAQVAENLVTYEAALGISTPTAPVTVFESKLLEQLSAPQVNGGYAVRNVVISAPAADVVLADWEVAVFAVGGVTFTPV